MTNWLSRCTALQLMATIATSQSDGCDESDDSCNRLRAARRKVCVAAAAEVDAEAMGSVGAQQSQQRTGKRHGSLALPVNDGR